MEITTNEKAIVITGGPGTGKTSIVEMLRHGGSPCIDESGRQIIRRQLKTKRHKASLGRQGGLCSGDVPNSA